MCVGRVTTNIRFLFVEDVVEDGVDVGVNVDVVVEC